MPAAMSRQVLSNRLKVIQTGVVSGCSEILLLSLYRLGQFSFSNITTAVLLLYFMFGLLAGLRTTMRSGRVETGLLAGLGTAFIGSFIATAAVTIVDYLWLVQEQTQRHGPGRGPFSPMFGFALIVIMMLALSAQSMISGLLAGTIGGYAGKRYLCVRKGV